MILLLDDPVDRFMDLLNSALRMGALMHTEPDAEAGENGGSLDFDKLRLFQLTVPTGKS